MPTFVNIVHFHAPLPNEPLNHILNVSPIFVKLFSRKNENFRHKAKTKNFVPALMGLNF
jgi:hypothetical protein